jgi:Putative ABC exporter
VIGTLLYLAVCSTRNRAIRRLRRLRQPRYLAGLIIGLLYFSAILVRSVGRGGRPGGGAAIGELVGSMAPELVAVGGFVLWLVAVVTWLVPSAPPWRFTGAEVQFLYTAPVSRRSLLHYKLLTAQLGVVFGTAIASVFSGAASARNWTGMLGGWLLLGTFTLHLNAVSLTKASLRASRRSWRAWLPPTVMAGASLLVIGDLAIRARGVLSVLEPRLALDSVAELLTGGIAQAVLWPFAALVAPMFAPSPAAFARAALPAVVLAALNYVWVLGSDVTFLDTVVEAEKDASARATPARAPIKRAAPFRLGVRGRPETAIVWKNVILLGRYASLRTLLRVLVPIGIMVVAAGQGGRSRLVLAPVALLIGLMATLFGPSMMRNDLRLDLPRLAVLKTWPIAGASILVGEMLAPAIVLSIVVWWAVGVAAALWGGDLPRVTPGARLTFAIVAAVIAPMLIAGQLVVQNAAVVLFPAWITTGPAKSRGVEAMGQNILMFAGTMFALAVGALPAAAAGGVVGFVLYSFVGLPGLVPAALVVSGVLLVESGLALALLGPVLERTEPMPVETAE